MSDTPILTPTPPSPLEVERELFSMLTDFFDKRLGVIQELLDKSVEVEEEQLEIQEERQQVEIEDRRERERNPPKVDFGEKAKELFNNLGSKFGRQAEGIGKAAVDMALGPFQLIAKPLESFLGFGMFDLVKGAFGKAKKAGAGLFGTGEDYKGTLSKKDIKAVDPGAAYIGDLLDVDGEGEEKKAGGFLQSLFGETGIGKIASSIFPFLMKALPIAAIIGGLIWGVMDAFKAVAMADDWGTGKVAAGIGGFLGGTGEGWSGAFANMGKWALIGAGAGFLFAGPIGALVGGLIGAAIGGILGYIGGEKIANFFQAIGDWFVQAWKDIGEFFKGVWTWLSGFVVGAFNSLITFFVDLIGWDSEDSIFKNIARAYLNLVTFVPKLIIGWIGNIFTGIGNFFRRVFLGEEDSSEVDEVEKGLMGRIGDVIVGISRNLFLFIRDVAQKAWTGVSSFVAGAVGGIVDFFKQAFESVKLFVQGIPDKVMQFVRDIPDNLMAGISGVTNFVRDHILPGIRNFFNGLFSELQSFISDPVDYVKGLVTNLISGITGFFSMISNFFGFVKDLGLRDLLSIISGGGFNQAFGAWTTQRDQEQDIKARLSTNARAAARMTALSEERGFLGVGRKYNDQEVLDIVAREFLGRDLKDERVRAASVNDAIITSNGQIIHTHPDDNIIATRNMPTQFDRAAMMDSVELSGIIENTSEQQTQSLLGALERLISAVQGQGDKGVFVNNTYTNRFSPENVVESLRTAY